MTVGTGEEQTEAEAEWGTCKRPGESADDSLGLQGPHYPSGGVGKQEWDGRLLSSPEYSIDRRGSAGHGSP